MIEEYPLPWLASLPHSVEHAKPRVLSLSKGEQRATEYSKAATRGNWNEVWDSFDSRKRERGQRRGRGERGQGHVRGGGGVEE